MNTDETTPSSATTEQGGSTDRRGLLKFGALAAAAGSVAAAGLFSSSAEAAQGGVLVPSPATQPQEAALPKLLEKAATHTQISLDIFNSAANLIKGWPLVSPAYFILPAFSLVTMSINCYDDGPAALLAGFSAFANVSGTVGDIAIYAMNEQSEKRSKDVGQVAPGAHSKIPANQISHTLTVPGLKLNVPVTALQTVSFMFYTDKPGMYEWMCEAPCGSGKEGMEGAMETLNFMRGYMFVK